jgi:hypothetical protein
VLLTTGNTFSEHGCAEKGLALSSRMTAGTDA